jgi:hypothetical protein
MTDIGENVHFIHGIPRHGVELGMVHPDCKKDNWSCVLCKNI